MLVGERSASADGGPGARRGARRRRRLRGAGLAAAWLLAGAGAARGELVTLASGHVLKVESHVVEGRRVRLRLPTGGELTLPLLRVERIVDDEIVTPAAPLAAPAAGLRFAHSHGVPETPYGELIYDVARRHTLNPELMAAMIRVESNFNPEAVSHKGAAGLMQLMPATARRFGVEMSQLHDPGANLEGGARYLVWLAERFAGELALVLAGYNAGEGAVERYAGVPPYRETREYIRRVYALLGVEGTPGR